MKIVLVGPELEENLSLRYLSAALESAGHQARLFDFHGPDQVAEIARTKMPDLNTDDLEAAKLQIAGTARSMGIKVV